MRYFGALSSSAAFKKSVPDWSGGQGQRWEEGRKIFRQVFFAVLLDNSIVPVAVLVAVDFLSGGRRCLHRSSTEADA